MMETTCWNDKRFKQPLSVVNITSIVFEISFTESEFGCIKCSVLVDRKIDHHMDSQYTYLTPLFLERNEVIYCE